MYFCCVFFYIIIIISIIIIIIIYYYYYYYYYYYIVLVEFYTILRNAYLLQCFTKVLFCGFWLMVFVFVILKEMLV